jgi:hypothetical protein
MNVLRQMLHKLEQYETISKYPKRQKHDTFRVNLRHFPSVTLIGPQVVLYSRKNFSSCSLRFLILIIK